MLLKAPCGFPLNERKFKQQDKAKSINLSL